MPVADHCLDADQVRALASDRLTLAEMGPTLEHLEACPRCADALHRLVRDDTPLPCVGAIDALTEGPEATVIQDLIARFVEQAAWKPSPAAAPVGDSSWATVQPCADSLSHASLPTLAVDRAAADTFPFLAPPQAPDEMGRLGRYRVLRVLGSGGMGVVFLAEDTHLLRPVALKVMRPELSASRDYRERFLREARSAATIEHDHIVTVYHADEDGGVPMLAMQLLQGETLEDRLKREGKLPTGEAARIGREIAEALHAAHGRGLIHRDIKPANVWLEGERRRVKVLDFGLARPVQGGGHLTATGAIMGTPAYMAPEQAEGVAVDHRADLFSLGVVLYRMVTGNPAFRGDSPFAILRSLANDTPRPAHEVAPEVPLPLSKLIHRLLSKDAAGRPASASQVAAELAVIETAPQAQPRRVRPRRRLLVAAAAACLLLAGAVVAMVTIKAKIPDGELVLTLPQDGLTVFIDGKEHTAASGETRRVALPPGKHQLTVKKAGTEVYAVVFTVKAGEPASVEVSLPPAEVVAGPGAKSSPLDALRREDIPASERFDWQPKELVAVLGTSAWRHWGPGQQPYKYLPHLSFGADGKQVVAFNYYGHRVHLSDAETGKELACPQPSPLVTKGGRLFPGLQGVSISPDNRTVAYLSGTAEEWSWTVWDVATSKTRVTIEGQNNPSLWVTLSPGGKLLAIESGSSVVLWDGVSGKRLDSAVADARHLAFSPDGKRLASTGNIPGPGKDGLVVKVWDVSGGSLKEKRSLEVPLKEAAKVAFSPDGNLLAVGGTGGHTTGNVQLVEISTGKLQRLFDGSKTDEPNTIQTFGFSPDGKTLAFGIANGTVRICDLTGKELRILPSGKWTTRDYRYNYVPIHSLAFRADNRALAVSSADGTIRLWDTETGKQINTVPEPVEYLGLSPDDKTLATRGNLGNVSTFYDVTTRKPVATHTFLKTQIVSRVTLTPDGKTFAARLGHFGPSPYVDVFDTATGEGQRRLGSTGYNGYATSRDGKTLAIGDYVNTSWQLWDTSTWKVRATVKFPEKTNSLLGVSPDGRDVAYGIGKTVRIQEVSSGKVKATLATPFEVHILAFSHDGKRVAAANGNGPFDVWDLETSKEVFSGSHHQTAMTFGPDNKTLITSGHDGHVIHWRSATDKTVWRFPGPTRVVSSDGRYLFAANGNGTIYVFRLAPPPAPKRKV